MSMKKLYMTFPAGCAPFENAALPIFINPDSPPGKCPYVFVARNDIAVNLSGLKKPRAFGMTLRQGDSIKGSMWSKFQITESNLPYPLADTDKPAHQREGWAGAHIYTLFTLSGWASIMAGTAGAANKPALLFPDTTKDYRLLVAQTCLDKHNELTGQHVALDDLAELTAQETTTTTTKKKRRKKKRNDVEGKVKKSNSVLPGKRKRVVDKLRVETARLTRQRAKLVAENAELVAENTKLVAENAKLVDKVRVITQLSEDLDNGLIERLPFVLSNDEGDELFCYVEVDVGGICRRVEVEDSNTNPFHEVIASVDFLN